MKYLETKNLYLRAFLRSDITEKYLTWLNDPEVNAYSVRRIHPYTDVEAIKYIESLSKDEKILAIFTKDDVHIGNIKYGPIDWVNRNCEISIVVGEKNYWNKGYASESMYALMKHLFFVLDINRIGADSCNPAFIKMVINKLGWRNEGSMHNRIRFGDKFVDYHILGILKDEFKVIEKYEK